MAAVREFSISCSKTFNLGNFQSLRVEASVTVSLDPGDNLHAATVDAQEELRKLLEQTYEEQYKVARTLA